MNILHVNASDLSGGAARAAYRLHSSLLQSGAAHGVQSMMRVITQTTDDPTVVSGPAAGQNRLVRAFSTRLNRLARRSFSTSNTTLHSTAWPSTGLGRELLDQRRRGLFDVIHLHWLADHTLSIEEIGLLPKPLVWTLHDQWPFCGSEHYTSSPSSGDVISCDERFAQSYAPHTRLSDESGPDLNRLTWMRKRRAWSSNPMHIVCPSHWMADCARRSSLMGDWPISVIPNPIDLRVWAPIEKRQARALLRLPIHHPLILFGAVGGTADPRKGADLLLDALQILRSQVDSTRLAQLELVVFGQSHTVSARSIGFPVHTTGFLHDDISLRLLYSAADVFVIPSRQDNLPNTGLEAHACGTPIVAFRTGGLPDIVDHGVSGALAEPFDPSSLAHAIGWVLEDPSRLRQLGAAGRSRAEKLWAPAYIVQQYAQLYRRLYESQVI